MARMSYEPLGRDAYACHAVLGTTAPVAGSSAASAVVLAWPLMLVNSPPTNSFEPSGDAISFQTGALTTGLKVGIHSPVFTSNAARYDCVKVGPPTPCCTWRNLPPRYMVLPIWANDFTYEFMFEIAVPTLMPVTAQG